MPTLKVVRDITAKGPTKPLEIEVQSVLDKAIGFEIYHTLFLALV